MATNTFDVEEYEDDFSEIEGLVDDIKSDAGSLIEAEDARDIKGMMKCMIENARKLIEQCEALAEKV